MNEHKELLEAKLALYKMIDQFMYEHKDKEGNEYYYNCCESAGEYAFNVLGFEDDLIRKEDFYRQYDEVLKELWQLNNNGTKREWSYLEWYLKDKAKKQKQWAEGALCNDCACNDCLICPYDDGYRCHGCPCDTCEITENGRSNYHSRG